MGSIFDNDSSEFQSDDVWQIALFIAFVIVVLAAIITLVAVSVRNRARSRERLLSKDLEEARSTHKRRSSRRSKHKSRSIQIEDLTMLEPVAVRDRSSQEDIHDPPNRSPPIPYRLTPYFTSR